MKPNLTLSLSAILLYLAQSLDANTTYTAQPPPLGSSQNTQEANKATNSTQTLDSYMLNQVSAFARKNAQLDSLNRNTYTLDKSQIIDKGYTSSTNIFQYMPFVWLNDTGLGSNIDLRAQGTRANTSVQVLVNGVPSNMLDSSHGVTPINTLSPYSIETIEILPGGGAVIYGNGTRGGVVSITTQQRYQSLFLSAGVSYSNIIASTGNNINADVKLGTKFRSDTHTPIYVSLGAAYIHRGGPRAGDLTQGAQANGSLAIDFSDKASLDFSLDYFAGSIKTSPNNSFQITPNPSRDDRTKAGYGSLHNIQHRLDASLGLVANLTQKSKLDVRTFFHLNRIDYVDSITNIASFSYGRASLDNVSANQNNSFFDDKKAGVITKYNLNHTNGRFIAGLESIYNRGDRTMNQHILWEGSVQMQPPVTKYDHTMNIPFQGSKWSNAAFILEKYDITKRFSLTSGARYEWAYYDIDVNYDSKINMNISPPPPHGTPMTIVSTAKGSLNSSLHNYAYTLTPSYAYSDSGAVYVKYEKGFFSPSPNSLLKRNGSSYTTTNLKKEEHHTIEAGIKDFFGDFLSLSLSAFYTLTTNEFYTIGNAHSLGGVSYNNYDFTQRAGLEVFSQQFFFNDRLHFSESFTYIDARILEDNGSKTNRTIPYTSNYKITLGASLALGRHWNLWTQHSFFGTQKDIVGTKIPAYSLSDLGVEAKYGGFSLSAGMRNVFNTFYYSYYNSDRSDPIAGYGFLIGVGRTLFVQGRYSF